ncbi:CvpA family protein [Pelagibacteraceae bacterium]|jgi:membrane protein required for colicin V production|nr:CvpA family protein [Pelagibacteraceae bacterium]
MNNLIEFIKEDILFFDIIFVLIILYNIIKCFSDGFSLSFISSLKWIASIIATIVFVPKLQPWVGSYVESNFINNVGIGIFIFVVTLFISIVLGKAIGRTVTWTGVGSVDKSFGILFGFFKGYIFTVCLFSLLNWFYPYEKWGISTTDALSFEVVKKGSDLLTDEFPDYKDIIETKEKIEKI